MNKKLRRSKEVRRGRSHFLSLSQVFGKGNEKSAMQAGNFVTIQLILMSFATGGRVTNNFQTSIYCHKFQTWKEHVLTSEGTNFQACVVLGYDLDGWTQFLIPVSQSTFSQLKPLILWSVNNKNFGILIVKPMYVLLTWQHQI